MTINIRRANSQARMVNYRRANALENSSIILKEQADAYERDMKCYGWITVASIEEVGSGCRMDREGLREVLALVQNGKVDGVYVTDPNRLCRPNNLTDLIEMYSLFSEKNVRLVTPKRVYDFSADDDLLGFDLGKVFAKHYQKRLFP